MIKTSIINELIATNAFLILSTSWFPKSSLEKRNMNKILTKIKITSKVIDKLKLKNGNRKIKADVIRVQKKTSILI
jgi:hypothetical protein